MARRRKPDFEAGMDKEIRFHLERSIENHMAAGISREEARQRALREFGPVELTKEAIRDTGHLRWLSGLSLDLKLAWRMLMKSPA